MKEEIIPDVSNKFLFVMGPSIAMLTALMAGVVARADQTAGKPLGFLNPAMYSLSRNASAIYDVTPAGKVDQSRADFANSLDTTDGLFYTTRIVDYEGPEHYCSDPTDPTHHVLGSPADVAARDWRLRQHDRLGAPNSGFVGSLVAAAK